MEYVLAAMMLNETGKEINERNLTGILEEAGVQVEESRVKALVAALEDVDLEQIVEEEIGDTAGTATQEATISEDDLISPQETD